jgi:long-chain fatty acid transport protein
MVFPPINAYITHQFKEGLVGGFGIFNAYGLGQVWDNESSFVGRHISYDVDLKTFYFNPTIAWRWNENVAVGGGVQAVYSSVELNKYIQKWDPNGSGLLDVGTVKLSGNSKLDWGGNLGILLNPNDDWKIGVAYRSNVDANINGNADFTQQSTGSPQFDAVVSASFPEDQKVETTVKIPWLVSIGGAYKGLEKWVFEVDFNIFGWSTFDELTFTFADDPSLNTTRIQNFENTLSIRTGLSYSLNEAVDLRGGYYWDPSPQPTEAMSPLLADIDRHGISLGVGYDRETWVLDFFGLALITGDRETEGMSLDDFNGTYGSYAFLAGVNAGFNF